MTKVRHKNREDGFPATYAELVGLLVPRPIGDKIAYENMVEMVDSLAGHRLNRDQEDYLEILSDLIENYEDRIASKLPDVSGIELLAYLLEENDLTGDDLAALLKVDRSVAYKILKGTRNLTMDHVRKLADRFAVRADLFI